MHRESYEVAEKLCNLFGIDVENLAKAQDKIESALTGIDKEDVAEQLNVSAPSLELINENLQKPGRDPRVSLPKPLLRQDVLKMQHLPPDMKLEVPVRN